MLASVHFVAPESVAAVQSILVPELRVSVEVGGTGTDHESSAAMLFSERSHQMDRSSPCGCASTKNRSLLAQRRRSIGT